MGLYIRGVGELPPGEYRMTLDVFKDGSAGVDFYSFAGGEDRFDVILCPPHGDLIDRDKFRNTVFIGEQCLYSWDELEDAIDYAPTIIPAEEGE